MRKTARKTTSNAVSQTTIDEFFHKDNADDDDTKSKQLKDDKHAFTAASMYNEKPAPLPRTSVVRDNLLIMLLITIIGNDNGKMTDYWINNGQRPSRFYLSK
jgi:hypothetical protein